MTVNREFEKTMAKRSKVMALMTENNQGQHFQGRLRFLFLQWAAHTKRHRAAAEAVRNAIEKSLW